jgi:hypothetical protein
MRENQPAAPLERPAFFGRGDARGYALPILKSFPAILA